MPPKQKQKQQTSRPRGGARGGQSQQRGSTPRPRRAPSRRGLPSTSWTLPRQTTEWFVAQQLDITSKTQAGLLSELWMHPTAMLGNPYSAVCANCTHRREFWWQLRVYTTSASFTGARVAVLALPDPSYSGGLTHGAVWGAVANGRGSMVDSTGNQQREARFQITGSTSVLSNARPPASGNMLGYADAVLILWLLQPPVALGADSRINVTVMVRVNLQGHNPVPGYLLTQLPNLTNQPPDRPQQGAKPAWIIKAKTTPVPGDTMTDWSYWHTGDAWLAGGWYFIFHGAHGTAPSPSPGIQILGNPLWGAVYTSSDTFPEWMTNRRHHAVPKYFACFLSPISRAVYLVGFTNFEWAKSQAAGLTGMVPPDVELCISYDNAQPKWSQFAGDTDKIQTYFYEVYRAEHGRYGSVYTTENEINAGDYPGDTWDLQAMASRLPLDLQAFLQPPLAQPWQSPYHQTPTSMPWSSETSLASPRLDLLLAPRYRVSSAHSMTSSSSSSRWSLQSEVLEPPPPTAPPMTLEELQEQLTRLAMDLPDPGCGEPQSEDLPEPERPPTPCPPDASPPPQHVDTGLPNWTLLWLRALQYAGLAPGTTLLPH
uniref:Polyprotein n=1 Tax=Riboviria sp. TaxID=2585031 RepID=A0A6M9Z8S1_9VIRU|nr:MAG: polyprotein [Riboviria sp.]